MTYALASRFPVPTSIRGADTGYMTYADHKKTTAGDPAVV